MSAAVLQHRPVIVLELFPCGCVQQRWTGWHKVLQQACCCFAHVVPWLHVQQRWSRRREQGLRACYILCVLLCVCAEVWPSKRCLLCFSTWSCVQGGACCGSMLVLLHCAGLFSHSCGQQLCRATCRKHCLSIRASVPQHCTPLHRTAGYNEPLVTMHPSHTHVGLRPKARVN